jgi:hypothetical protein
VENAEQRHRVDGQNVDTIRDGLNGKRSAGGRIRAAVASGRGVRTASDRNKPRRTPFRGGRNSVQACSTPVTVIVPE